MSATPAETLTAAERKALDVIRAAVDAGRPARPAAATTPDPATARWFQVYHLTAKRLIKRGLAVDVLDADNGDGLRLTDAGTAALEMAIA